MELKREDFILVTALNGQKVLGLRPDYFTKKSTEEKVKEVFETKVPIEIVENTEPVKTVIIETAPSDLESNPPPEPKPDPLAKARAAKAIKRDALKAELEALE